jgi:quinol monooxygenase YgiN
MFTVRVAARVRPEGRQTFLAQLKKEQREVPTMFEGCERYAVFSDPADPNSILLYEEWRDADAAHAYMTSPYFEAAGSILRPLIAGDPDSAYYESVRVGP